MKDSPPPPIQKGDWIERNTGPLVSPWAIVRHVYTPDWIEVAYCTLDSVDKNDWKWTGRTWRILADYGKKLEDRRGLLRQMIETGPPDDLLEGDVARILPHTVAVVWRATRTEDLH